MAGPVQLAELLCARFSHDLSGLLGSLNGVLELVAEAPGGAPEEVALAVETASEMMVRLQCLRAAWGAVSEPMDLPTLRTRMRGVAGHQRLELDLDGLAGNAVFPPPMARLVLNIVLLAAEALPRGGVIGLSGDPAGALVAQIAGPDAAWPAGLARFLADDEQAWAALGNPRDLQAPLTALIARSMGMRLSMLMGPVPPAPGTAPPLLLAPTAD